MNAWNQHLELAAAIIDEGSWNCDQHIAIVDGTFGCKGDCDVMVRLTFVHRIRTNDCNGTAVVARRNVTHADIRLRIDELIGGVGVPLRTFNGVSVPSAPCWDQDRNLYILCSPLGGLAPSAVVDGRSRRVRYSRLTRRSIVNVLVPVAQSALTVDRYSRHVGTYLADGHPLRIRFDHCLYLVNVWVYCQGQRHLDTVYSSTACSTTVKGDVSHGPIARDLETGTDRPVMVSSSAGIDTISINIGSIRDPHAIVHYKGPATDPSTEPAPIKGFSSSTCNRSVTVGCVSGVGEQSHGN